MERRENLLFFLSPLSLSLSLSLCLLLSLIPLLFSFLRSSPLFALHFISFSFSLFSHFLISLFSFIFSFLFLLWIASTEWSQKWETSSLLPPLPLVIFTFFLIFFISLYFPHVTYGSMLAIYHNLLQHMAIMPLSSTQGSMWHPHGPIMCYPTLDTSENVKFRLSWNPTKFDKVTRFREMNSKTKSILSSEI